MSTPASSKTRRFPARARVLLALSAALVFPHAAGAAPARRLARPKPTLPATVEPAADTAPAPAAAAPTPAATVETPAALSADPSAPPPAPAVVAPSAPAEPLVAPVAEAKAPEADPVAPGEAAPAPEVKAEPLRNQNLEYARELLAAGRPDEALAELDVAARYPGNTPRMRAEIAAARVEGHLGRASPNRPRARELVVQLLREDPAGEIFAGASEPVLALVAEVRAEQVLVVHERPGPVRPDRPVRLRARVLDPRSQVYSVVLRYRGTGHPSWSEEPMRRDAGGWSGFVRSPGALAPTGVSDDFVVEYFISALDPAGKTLDANGTAAEPLRLDASTLRAQEAEAARNAQLIALGEIPELLPPPPPPPTPWYLRWYSLTAGGVLATGLVVGTVAALSQPPPLPRHDAKVVLP